MFNDTCAIIITYNPNLTEVETLIERISKHVGLILIVDNGSENVAELRSLSAHVVKLGENRGIATAQNVGIRVALECDYRFVLLFDHDSLPAYDMVQKLRAAFDALSQQGVRVAAVGPNYIERNDGNIQEPLRRTGWVKKDAIISSGALMSAEALRDVGLMADELFIDWSDIEWCLRATRKHREHRYRIETQHCYKIYMVRDALMGHTMGVGVVRVWSGLLGGGLIFTGAMALLVPREFTLLALLFIAIGVVGAGFRYFEVHAPFRDYYKFRNLIHLCLRSPYRRSWKLRALTVYCVQFTVALLGLFSGSYWARLKMMLLGVWHGVSGRLGSLSNALDPETKSLVGHGALEAAHRLSGDEHRALRAEHAQQIPQERAAERVREPATVDVASEVSRMHANAATARDV